MIKYLYLLSASLAFWCNVKAQTINTFPFTESFDGFPVSSQVSPVNEPNPDTFPSSWINDSLNDGNQDWYGLSSSTFTSSTGPDGDHTSGNGVYLYVEDSGGGANNEEVSILSPQIDISGLQHPRLSFWIHSHANISNASYGQDSSLNDLRVDLLHMGIWTSIDSADTVGSDWMERIVALDSFSGLIQIRFTVNNNNYGDFIHDIAIDDFTIFDQLDVDGAIVTGTFKLLTPVSYSTAPFAQKPTYQFESKVQNRGMINLSHCLLHVEIGAYIDSSSIDTLSVFEDTNVVFSNAFNPTSDASGYFELNVMEDDTNLTNNFLPISIPDTVLARDFGIADGSIGFSGSSTFLGNTFELTWPDQCTSASFYLKSPTIGDSLRVLLYRFGQETAGQPDEVPIDSTNYWQINAQGWHALSFKCPVHLDPGTYLLAVEQANTNSLGFGYNFKGYSPATTFFKTSGAASWDTLETAIPALNATMMLRMNFGPVFQTEITSNATQICHGDSIMLSATGTGSFLWLGDAVDTITSGEAIAFPDTNQSIYIVHFESNNGCHSSDTFSVVVNEVPVVSISSSADTNGSGSGVATAAVAGGLPPYQYLWNDQEVQTTPSATGLVAGTYEVQIVDSNGCLTKDSVSIGNFNSIQPLIELSKVRLYPNPNDGNFMLDLSSLQFPRSIEISLINTSGAIIFQKQSKQETFLRVNLKNRLPSGIYTLLLRSAQNVYRSKLIIQNQ